jgi:hypothetical protein
MLLELRRVMQHGEATLGALFVDGALACFTLEDAWHADKVPGATRIPAGRYIVAVRTYGATHQKYAARYDFHRGMLELLSVPNYSDVLIHIGNTERDTAGCILVGDSIHASMFLEASLVAYRRVYNQVMKAIDNVQGVVIEVSDHDEWARAAT